MEDIKNYLHLYPKCECMYDTEQKSGLIGVITPKIIEWGMYGENYSSVRNVKPILRPLSDLGDYEKLARDEFATSKEKPFHYSFAMETLWYLKNGFDVFNLIPKGLAIDKTKIGLNV